MGSGTMTAPLRLIFTRSDIQAPDALERSAQAGMCLGENAEVPERAALARDAWTMELLAMSGAARLAEVRQMIVDVLDVFEQDADEPRVIAALDAFDSAGDGEHERDLAVKDRIEAFACTTCEARPGCTCIVADPDAPDVLAVNGRSFHWSRVATGPQYAARPRRKK